MPTNRVRTARRGGLDEYKRQELLTGEECLLAGLGYYRYPDQGFDLEAMRKDWHMHKHSLLAEWEATYDDGDSKPYAWHLFGA